jgi:predicted pyridoxine 5'-phosphate oxidase superfamily flavin-nucleotide-binding protein
MSTLPPNTSPHNFPFHAGELAIQERAGTLAASASMGQRFIRDHMPDQHREFYSQLPFVLVGSVDQGGQPWASMLVGLPGFMNSPDPQTLRVNAKALPGDRLAENLHVGSRLGMLGIELPTRRRNRMNGTVTKMDDSGFTVAVDQSFGNCPQYIQQREPTFVVPPGPLEVYEYESLTKTDCELIEVSDTFFIASNAAASSGTPNSAIVGADVSHRGGRAGFVRVEDGHTLLVPDFPGNRFYQTLGNLHLDPRAGLFFIDFETGDFLQVSCNASLVWGGPEVAAFAGAERLLRLRVKSVRRVKNSLPIRWAEPTFWPLLASTGTWEHADIFQSLKRKDSE